MSCAALGDGLAALVDGELDHPGRERAQTHLLHCDPCRAEVDAQRRLKARLGGLAGPAPSADLIARLRELAAAGPPPALRSSVSSAAPAAGVARPPARPPGSSAPAGRPSRPRGPARRRATVGSTLAVIGVGVLIALGGPRSGEDVVPVDPAGDGFVVDYVNRTGGVSGTAEPAMAAIVP